MLEFGKGYIDKEGDTMERREFLRKGLVLGAGLVPGVGLAGGLLGDSLQIANAVLPPHTDSGWSVLFVPTRLGHVDAVKSLLLQSINLNERNQHGNMPLHVACIPTVLEQAKRMHFYNPDLNIHSVEEFYGKQITHNEVTRYQSGVSLMEEAGIDWRSQIPNDGSPIFQPGKIARREIAKILINSGADINARDEWNYTSLHWAAQTSDIEFVQYLIRLGVERDARDQDGWTYLCHAAIFSDVEMMRFLIESGVDPHIQSDIGVTLLHHAARNFDVSVLQYLVSLGLDPFAKMTGNIEYQPIHCAAEGGCVHSVRYLVGLGANVNAKTADCTTPLHLACDTRIAQFLIDAGADIEAKDYYGSVPLHTAAGKNHPGIVKLLLDAGAKVDAQCIRQSTPLHRAAMEGSTETAKLLIDAGADLEVFDDMDFTPLHEAAFDGHLGTVQMLIKSGADFDVRDVYYATPLILAIRGEHSDVTEYLISCGADPLNSVLEIRIAKSLTPLVNPDGFLNHISRIREKFASAVGFTFPQVHVRCSEKLEPDQYQFFILGKPVITGKFTTALEHCKTFTEIITSHFLETTLAHSDKLMTWAITDNLLDELKKTSPALIAGLIPNIMSDKEILDALRFLLKEQIPIHKLETILEVLLEHGEQTKDPVVLCEHVRQRLALLETKVA